MSPVNHRGRRRLGPDRPVERLRGLLAEDLAAATEDLAAETTDLTAETMEDPDHLDSRAPAIPGQYVDPVTGEITALGGDEPDWEGTREQRWRTPVRWRVPWPAVVIAAVAVIAVVATVLWPAGDGQNTGELSVPLGSSATRAPATAESATQASNAGQPTAGAGQSAGGAGNPGSVVVHVVGEVRHPGVVEVPGDARVQDAVEAAGGLTAEAVVDRVNLAAAVTDGSQILIPNLEQADQVAASGGSANGGSVEGGAVEGAAGSGTASSAQPGPASGGAAAGTGGQGAEGGLVNLNTAGVSELETLPRVGPVTAQKIIDHREQIGGFRSVEELDDVAGIGPAMMTALTPLVTV